MTAAQGSDARWLAIAFPFGFVGLWLALCSLLGAMSGWYGLAARFPDRPGDSRRTLRCQSGLMGAGVSLNGILTLSVCEGGLRIAIWRIFGPFSAPFFVPWSDLTVERRRSFVLARARLAFGRPETGALTLPADVADRLARAAGGSWPEPGQFPRESLGRTLAVVSANWALATAFIATFFFVTPRLFHADGVGMPIAASVAFPALLFGVVAVVTFVRRRQD